MSIFKKYKIRCKTFIRSKLTRIKMWNILRYTIASFPYIKYVNRIIYLRRSKCDRKNLNYDHISRFMQNPYKNLRRFAGRSLNNCHTFCHSVLQIAYNVGAIEISFAITKILIRIISHIFLN